MDYPEGLSGSSRQSYYKRRSDFWLASYFNRPLVLLNYRFGDSKAQAKPGLLGGKIRLEDFTQGLFADTHAGITHSHFNTSIHLRDMYAQLAAARHRLKRIDRNV